VLIDLLLEPRVQFVHHRPTVRLMELQASFRRELFFSRLGVVLGDDFQGFQQLAALVVEVLRHIGELAAGVSQAVG